MRIGIIGLGDIGGNLAAWLALETYARELEGAEPAAPETLTRSAHHRLQEATPG